MPIFASRSRPRPGAAANFLSRREEAGALPLRPIRLLGGLWEDDLSSMRNVFFRVESLRALVRRFF